MNAQASVQIAEPMRWKVLDDVEARPEPHLSRNDK